MPAKSANSFFIYFLYSSLFLKNYFRACVRATGNVASMGDGVRSAPPSSRRARPVGQAVP